MAPEIGETLRQARRRLGVGLGDAAAETRVREGYLAALEEEDFGVLGGDVYVKGFLRSYARFLRLDPEPLVEAYRQEHEGSGDEISELANQRPIAPLDTERRPAIIVGAGVAALLIVLFAVIGLGNDDGPSEAEVARQVPPPASEPSSLAGAGTGASETLAGDGQRDQNRAERAQRGAERELVVSEDEVELELETSGGESWFLVVVDGVEQFEGIQGEGETSTYVADEAIEVTIGDAGVVEVTLNGERFGVLGRSRETLERTYLAEDAA